MTKRMLVSLAAAATLLHADTLVLRSGIRLDGNFIGSDGRSISFAVGNHVNTYYVNEVESIRFTGGGPQASAPPPSSYPQNQNYPQAQSYPPSQNYPQNQSYPQNQNYPPPSNGNYSQSQNYPPPPPPANGPAAQVPYQSAPTPIGPNPNAPVGNPSGIEVPSGTEIVVRMIDPVDSQRDNLGQTYRATIDQPVVVNGNTVIPRGSDAVATLIDDKQSGKIEGKTVLTLDLKNVTVSGHTYDIVTTGVSKASSSRGARSAKVIGGAAALGAIIGAAAGGGKGAAIGAGSGAAVGTAAEVVTSGQRVKIPSETRLTFTLQNPIDL